MSDESLFEHINDPFFGEILDGLDKTTVIDMLNEFSTNILFRRVLIHDDIVEAVVYFYKNEIVVVGFDLESMEYQEQEWLATEEVLPSNNVPMFFSESFELPSPVFAVQKLMTLYTHLLPQNKYRVYGLVVCNYSIINTCDFEEAWKSKHIYVVDGVENALQYELPDSEEEPEDSSISEKEDEEFSKALDEFVQRELKQDAEKKAASQEPQEEKEEDGEIPLPPEEDDNLDSIDSATSPFEGIDFTDSEEDEEPTNVTVELRRYPPPSVFSKEMGPWPALKSFALRKLGCIMVMIDFTYKSCPKRAGVFECLLYNETGQVLLTEKLTGQVLITEKLKGRFEPETLFHVSGKVDFFINDDESLEWKKGRYLLEVRYHDETLLSAAFSVGNKDVEGTFSQYGSSETEEEGPMERLNRMTGLSQVKEQMTNYRDMVKLLKLRAGKRLQTSELSLHAIFMGNPGTGKTTVARLYGAMLKELGLLSSGHVVVASRSTLLGENYSSEEKNTLESIEKAKGGVLFIDEAYTLYKKNDPRDPGRNVLDALLTAMEKDDWAVLLAGYDDEMIQMLSSNPGFESRIPQKNRYHFEDYSVDELMSIADGYCESHNYILTLEARKALQAKVTHDYSRRDRSFGNGRYIVSLLSGEVLQSMSLRIGKIKNPTLYQLMAIEKGDIPAIRLRNYESPLRKLHDMVGLSSLKQGVESHLNMVRMSMLRNAQGIPTHLPPLHMVFTGNPGTGKTTVADLIGEVYASLGLLSVGRVIRVERKDLVGRFVGETERKTAEVLRNAKGNVLFIDEAYTLCDGQNSSDNFGRRAIETLLTTLSQDSIDMLVILAGYPEEMERLLDLNPGLRSRIPYTFHFEDYTVDELMEIARGVAESKQYRFTRAALKALRALVEEKMSHRDAHWGNARFITRLIDNTIVPRMGERLNRLPSHKIDKNTLQTICLADIPTTDKHESKDQFDEAAIRRALKRLDGMVGLTQVKQNIHNFVEVARYLHATERSYSELGSLRWNFEGNTGTGKSTVAGIMGELLKAMNILEKGHLVELKAEELYYSPQERVDDILQTAMLRSSQGLLFIDGDSQQFSGSESRFNSDSLLVTLSSMMAELPGAYALVIAEHESRNHALVQTLRDTGLPEFDHTFTFPDYADEELLQILEQGLKRRKLSLSAEASDHLLSYIQGLCSRRDLGYANARTMKLMSDTIAQTCWLRVGKEGKADAEVIQEDVASFVWKGMADKKRIGYK